MADDRKLKKPTWAERVQRISAIDLFEKYRQRMVNRDTQLPFEPSQSGSALTMERLVFETRRGMQVALKLFFPVCALCFSLSFLWDFKGLIRSCSVAGMIGFATNWVAVKMLFWPRHPRPVFGQGLIPSQRDQLVEKVADEVLENLINEELILQKVDETRIVGRLTTATIEKLGQVTKDPEFKDDLRHMILSYVAELTSNSDFREGLTSRLENTVEEVAGDGFKRWLVGRLRGAWRGPLSDAINQQIEDLENTVDGGLEHFDDIIERLPTVLEARKEAIEKVLSRMLIGLVHELDVRQIVLEQLDQVTVEQLERGFKEFSDDKLSFITLLGGALGVVGGTVIVWPLPSIAALMGLGLLLLVADIAMGRLFRALK